MFRCGEALVVSVDVEKDGGQDTSLWQAVLLFSSSATLIVQFHIDLLQDSIILINLHSGLS